MIVEKYTKDYLLNFLRFSHINTDLYKGLNYSIEKFLKVYDNIIFENEFKIDTIKHQFVYLQHFCKYLFHDNFNGYTQYYKYITPFINKNTYGKT